MPTALAVDATGRSRTCLCPKCAKSVTIVPPAGRRAAPETAADLAQGGDGYALAFADINGNVHESSNSQRTSVAKKKKYRKMTREEHARQLENQRRLEQVIEQRLERDGTTREEIRRKLGLP
jgi:hypothetical protein